MEGNVAVTTGLTDLLASERGWAFLICMVCATTLAGLKIITADQWLSFTQLIGGVLIGSKTITTAIETWGKRAPVATNGATTAPAPSSPAPTPPSTS